MSAEQPDEMERRKKEEVIFDSAGKVKKLGEQIEKLEEKRDY